MSKSSVRVFDAAFLEQLCAAAAATPRRRKNFNLHATNEDACHRFFNAMCADSYVMPHRHLAPTKDESLVVLRGMLGMIIFDDQGQVEQARSVRVGQVADVPHQTFHTWVALEDGTVFFEAKAGPFIPLQPAELAPFAPPEGDPQAAEYLAWLKSLCRAP